MNPIIAVHDLSFTYPDGRQALHNINLTIRAGEKVALVGANGAGKSTLLLHLNGILRGSGRIFVDGLEINSENARYIRTVVGIVFQDPDDQLFSPTVFDDVAYGPMYQGLSKAAVRERVVHALQVVRMEEHIDRVPYHLSYGEKKRIAIATVLSMQPKVLVLDEPTLGLDPRARRELTELLAGFVQTMLIATHDLELAKQLTRRTILLSQGRIVADGATEGILQDEKLLAMYGMS